MSFKARYPGGPCHFRAPHLFPADLITIKAARPANRILFPIRGRFPEAILDHMAEFKQALEKLLEELSRHENKTDPSAQSATSGGAGPDPESSILRELTAYLEETRDDIGQVLASHPAATAGAAFLLGVAVGRLSR